MNKEIKKYINKVSKYLLCDNTMKRKFLRDFKTDVLEYAKAENISDIDKIKAHFGEPEKIARAFLMESDIRDIKKRLTVKRIILISAIIVITVFVSTYITSLVWERKDVNNTHYYTESLVDGNGNTIYKETGEIYYEK